LMTTLMGENLMRKDGEAHQSERKAIFPTVSPRTIKDVWLAQFIADAERLLTGLAPLGKTDLLSDYAMLLSGAALRAITGLTNMTAEEMNRVSQGMIDGCANYTGDSQVEANCHNCTASIDRHIDAMIPLLEASPNHSLLSVQLAAWRRPTNSTACTSSPKTAYFSCSARATATRRCSKMPTNSM